MATPRYHMAHGEGGSQQPEPLSGLGDAPDPLALWNLGADYVASALPFMGDPMFGGLEDCLHAHMPHMPPDLALPPGGVPSYDYGSEPMLLNSAEFLDSVGGGPLEPPGDPDMFALAWPAPATWPAQPPPPPPPAMGAAAGMGMGRGPEPLRVAPPPALASGSAATGFLPLRQDSAGSPAVPAAPPPGPPPAAPPPPADLLWEDEASDEQFWEELCSEAGQAHAHAYVQAAAAAEKEERCGGRGGCGAQMAPGGEWAAARAAGPAVQPDVPSGFLAPAQAQQSQLPPRAQPPRGDPTQRQAPAVPPSGRSLPDRGSFTAAQLGGHSMGQPLHPGLHLLQQPQPQPRLHSVLQAAAVSAWAPATSADGCAHSAPPPAGGLAVRVKEEREARDAAGPDQEMECGMEAAAQARHSRSGGGGGGGGGALHSHASGWPWPTDTAAPHAPHALPRHHSQPADLSHAAPPQHHHHWEGCDGQREWGAAAAPCAPVLLASGPGGGGGGGSTAGAATASSGCGGEHHGGLLSHEELDADVCPADFASLRRLWPGIAAGNADAAAAAAMYGSGNAAAAYGTAYGSAPAQPCAMGFEPGLAPQGGLWVGGAPSLASLSCAATPAFGMGGLDSGHMDSATGSNSAGACLMQWERMYGGDTSLSAPPALSQPPPPRPLIPHLPHLPLLLGGAQGGGHGHGHSQQQAPVPQMPWAGRSNAALAATPVDPSQQEQYAAAAAGPASCQQQQPCHTGGTLLGEGDRLGAMAAAAGCHHQEHDRHAPMAANELSDAASGPAAFEGAEASRAPPPLPGAMAQQGSAPALVFAVRIKEEPVEQPAGVARLPLHPGTVAMWPDPEEAQRLQPPQQQLQRLLQQPPSPEVSGGSSWTAPAAQAVAALPQRQPSAAAAVGARAVVAAAAPEPPNGAAGAATAAAGASSSSGGGASGVSCGTPPLPPPALEATSPWPPGEGQQQQPQGQEAAAQAHAEAAAAAAGASGADEAATWQLSAEAPQADAAGGGGTHRRCAAGRSPRAAGRRAAVEPQSGPPSPLQHMQEVEQEEEQEEQEEEGERERVTRRAAAGRARAGDRRRAAARRAGRSGRAAPAQVAVKPEPEEESGMTGIVKQEVKEEVEEEEARQGRRRGPAARGRAVKQEEAAEYEPAAEGGAGGLGARKGITKVTLRPFFRGPIQDAAARLGLCRSALKKVCRQLGFTRWPSRKLACLDKMRDTVARGEVYGEAERKVLLARIDANCEAILANPNAPLDTRFNQLRQMQYKERSRKRGSSSGADGAGRAAGPAAAGGGGGGAERLRGSDLGCDSGDESGSIWR